MPEKHDDVPDYLRAMLDAIEPCVLFLDDHFRIKSSIGNSGSTLGRQEHELAGLAFHELFISSDFSATIEPALLSSKDNETTLENFIDLKDIGRRFLKMHFRGFNANNNKLASGTIVSITDLSKQKQLTVERNLYEKQLSDMASQISLAEERERGRISTALHDNIIQNLGMIKIYIENTRKNILEGTDSSESLWQALNLTCQTIDESRALMLAISPPVLQEIGLLSSIKSSLENFTMATGIEGNYNISINDTELFKLEHECELVVYQVVNECLSNIRKHARASEVSINFSYDQQHAILSVADNGIGFDVSKNKRLDHETSSGYGLLSMQQRLQHVNCFANIESAPGSGTNVHIHIPKTLLENYRLRSLKNTKNSFTELLS